MQSRTVLVIVTCVLVIISAILISMRKGDDASVVESGLVKTVEAPLDQVTILKVGDRLFKVKLAISEEEQEKGLSGVEDIPEDEGMYFIFPESIAQSFWNKGMLIPFDLIWVKDGSVVGIEDSISKEEDGLVTVDPPVEIDGALEIRAGNAKRLEIKIGDKIELN